MTRFILILSFVLLHSLSNAQVTQMENFTLDTSDSVTFALLNNWVMLRGTTSDLVVDYINAESKKIGITQNIPVKYTFLGKESDGGYVKMTSIISIYNGKVSYVIDKAEHESVAATGHKSGGNIFPEKPPKGKGIMKKTWLGYQSQLNRFIDGDVTKLKEHLNGT